jgi:hypothetical protein
MINKLSKITATTFFTVIIAIACNKEADTPAPPKSSEAKVVSLMFKKENYSYLLANASGCLKKLNYTFSISNIDVSKINEVELIPSFKLSVGAALLVNGQEIFKTKQNYK